MESTWNLPLFAQTAHTSVVWVVPVTLAGSPTTTQTSQHQSTTPAPLTMWQTQQQQQQNKPTPTSMTTITTSTEGYAQLMCGINNGIQAGGESKSGDCDVDLDSMVEKIVEDYPKTIPAPQKQFSIVQPNTVVQSEVVPVLKTPTTPLTPITPTMNTNHNTVSSVNRPPQQNPTTQPQTEKTTASTSTTPSVRRAVLPKNVPAPIQGQQPTQSEITNFARMTYDKTVSNVQVPPTQPLTPFHYVGDHTLPPPARKPQKHGGK